jgi:hypothetical protein
MGDNLVADGAPRDLANPTTKVVALLFVADGGELNRFVISLRLRQAFKTGILALDGQEAIDVAWLVATAKEELAFAIESDGVISHRMIVKAEAAKEAVLAVMKACHVS